MTEKQKNLLQLLSDGYTHKAIAIEKKVSIRTVQSHFRNIRKILGCISNEQAVKKAAKAGIIL